jgi:hypothetical protein
VNISFSEIGKEEEHIYSEHENRKLFYNFFADERKSAWSEV